MRYDKNGRMIGYDAMEKLTRGMPAGVPIAMVMQYFVHDQEGTRRTNCSIVSYLLSTRRQKKRTQKDTLSHFRKRIREGRKRNRSNIGICWRCDNRYRIATVNFAKDPSWENAASIVMHLLGMNSMALCR